jgi:predicted amidohydrolase YtcJ
MKPNLNLFPDLVLRNGKLITVDEQNSIYQAIAIRDGRILMVGANEFIDEIIGDKTEIIDLGGKTVLPGLIDSHLHLGSYGVF